MLLIAITPRRPLNFGTFNSRTFIKQPCKAWTCLQLISSKHFRRHKISQNGPRWFKKLTFSPVKGQMRNQIQTSFKCFGSNILYGVVETTRCWWQLSDIDDRVKTKVPSNPSPTSNNCPESQWGSRKHHFLSFIYYIFTRGSFIILSCMNWL